MDNKFILDELFNQKRTYESLLALNASVRQKSPVIESLLNAQLQRVLCAIMRQQQRQR